MGAYQIECLKLFKRKSTKVLVILYSILVLCLSAGYLFGERQLGLNIFSEGQFIGGVLTFAMSFILPFIALYVSSTSFALDFSQGTIKNMFLLPIRKDEIYSAKLMAAQTLMGLLLMIQFIFSIFLGVLLDGGFGITMLFSYGLQYIGAFIILGLLILLSAFLSLLVSSTGLALLLSYLSLMAMNVISIYLPQFRLISLPVIIKHYGTLMTRLNPSQLLSVVAYYIILFMVGYLIFEKKDDGACQYE
jgi:ABC-type transport system involved in multi-copper enzyme maturation permease subunit